MRTEVTYKHDHSGKTIMTETMPEVVETNLNAWKQSRVRGISASMCMDSPSISVEMIKAFDEVRKL